MKNNSKISLLIISSLAISVMSTAMAAPGPAGAPPTPNYPDAVFNKITSGSNLIPTNSITGTSSIGTGVQGTSTSGPGVNGSSGSGTGVYGTSGSGSAVHGRSASGRGVWAESISGLGLDAFSSTGIAVRALSSTTNALEATGSDNAAVFTNSSNGGITYIGTKAGGTAGAFARGILTKGDIESWFNLILKGAAYNNNPLEPFKVGDTDGFRVQDAPTAPTKTVDIMPNGNINLFDTTVPTPVFNFNRSIDVGGGSFNGYGLRFPGPLDIAFYALGGGNQMYFRGASSYWFDDEVRFGGTSGTPASYNASIADNGRITSGNITNAGGFGTTFGNYASPFGSVNLGLGSVTTSIGSISTLSGNISTTSGSIITNSGSINTTLGSIFAGGTITGAVLKGSCAGALAAKCADFAEVYKTSERTESGDLLMVDSKDSSKLMKAKMDQADLMVGVVSTSAGVTLGVDGQAVVGGKTQDLITDSQTVMGLAGQLLTKVSTENGLVEVGDLITVSSVAGVGMKANDGDATVGMALEAFDGKGIGKINVLISRNNGASKLVSGLKNEVDRLVLQNSELEKRISKLENFIGKL